MNENLDLSSKILYGTKIMEFIKIWINLEVTYFQKRFWLMKNFVKKLQLIVTKPITLNKS